MANIDTIDLNLLRLFDAVYRTRNVSRAAEELGLSQPATSQALTRLRLLLRDPLFERVAGGVRPTARSERLAHSVQAGLALRAKASTTTTAPSARSRRATSPGRPTAPATASATRRVRKTWCS